MKKLVSLILALALALVAVSAFAAGSKTNNDIATTTVTNTTTTNTTEETKDELTSEIVEESEETAELIKEFAEALVSGNILAVFPEEVQAEIPDDYTNINEIVTVKLSGDVAGVTSLTVNYEFETKYTAGEKVIMAYGIPKADGTIEWILVEGTVQEDGSVNVTLDEELIAKLIGKEVTLAVISK